MLQHLGVLPWINWYTVWGHHCCIFTFQNSPHITGDGSGLQADQSSTRTFLSKPCLCNVCVIWIRLICWENASTSLERRLLLSLSWKNVCRCRNVNHLSVLLLDLLLIAVGKVLWSDQVLWPLVPISSLNYLENGLIWLKHTFPLCDGSLLSNKDLHVAFGCRVSRFISLKCDC